MKTRKENFVNVENKSFSPLKKNELMKIKGSNNEPIGEPIQEDGDFE